MGEDEDGLVFGPGMPPEQAAHIREHLAHQRMAAAEANHALVGFIRDLTKEQKIQLRRLLICICESEEPTDTANYYAGLLSAYLDSQHGMCPCCGMNHDEELTAMLGDGQ